eukprot:1196383-Prorocentrum_minimum.AAC.4
MRPNNSLEHCLIDVPLHGGGGSLYVGCGVVVHTRRDLVHLIAIVWTLRAIMWTLRATMWMLRATLWTLRAMVRGRRTYERAP